MQFTMLAAVLGFLLVIAYCTPRGHAEDAAPPAPAPAQPWFITAAVTTPSGLTHRYVLNTFVFPDEDTFVFPDEDTCKGVLNDPDFQVASLKALPHEDADKVEQTCVSKSDLLKLDAGGSNI
jgi:hypothetical protein